MRLDRTGILENHHQDINYRFPDVAAASNWNTQAMNFSGQLEVKRIQETIPFQDQVRLGAATRASVIERAPAGQARVLLVDFRHHDRFEQGARRGMSFLSQGRSKPAQMADQAGAGQVAFGLAGNSLIRFPR